MVNLTDNQIFVDRVLPPAAASSLKLSSNFPPSYFLNLHEKVRIEGTYNYAGARIKLEHSKINVEKFRELLKGNDIS